MIKIEINETDGKMNNKQVVSKSTGEVLTFREQVAYIYNGGIYPEKFILQLDKDDSPYPAGFYTLDSTSFSVGDFGSLKIKKVKMIPFK
ncbi:TPA: single-stranded DNA-binding protein [Morganella morganii]|uniref:single-stranded DNA-binding protein n=1 Tax=Morganella morganii TaxID=582 RepID=UPI0005FAF1C8|nr:single-stranded DNA-binding protein [Morganella morganii]ELA7677288.1 V protein [Morganella morganii]KJY04704.1 Helix-destabilising protein [Morganella morganii]MBT0358935.1 V protein [Morganella morganii subsp. morganii]MBT0512028.1 V protein [Morganella morganii subsp. morganii]MDU2630980.1 single-stranded DNA-binding protein [Morganella morganii]